MNPIALLSMIALVEAHSFAASKAELMTHPLAKRWGQAIDEEFRMTLKKRQSDEEPNAADPNADPNTDPNAQAPAEGETTTPEPGTEGADAGEQESEETEETEETEEPKEPEEPKAPEDENVIDRMLRQNREWAEDQSEETLANLKAGQSPNVLWIGCADSRVAPEILLGLEPGEIFVHRNVGNIAHPYDDNILGVIEYALMELKIEHVMVAGHYECGGVKSVLDGIDNHGMYVLDGWLTQMENLMIAAGSELEGLDDDAQWRRLAELNALQSAEVINNSKVARDARKEGTKVTVHACVYDIGKGLLNCMDSLDEQSIGNGSVVPGQRLTSASSAGAISASIVATAALAIAAAFF